jgi:hypothetical protein
VTDIDATVTAEPTSSGDQPLLVARDLVKNFPIHGGSSAGSWVTSQPSPG